MWNLPHEVWVHYCDIGLIAPCAQLNLMIFPQMGFLKINSIMKKILLVQM
jgi:hypothetical protein